tara:strand:- start:502 stop:2052 length:1551 start_codon:yes stop_codon:yes gene_type:complete
LNLKKHKIYFEKLFILFLGVASSFSLPPYNYWFINFITFSFFFSFLCLNQNKSVKNFFLFGYFFGFGYFVSNLYWIPFSLTFDDNYKFLIPFALIIIPAFLSLFYGLALVMFKLLFNSKSIFVNLLIFSLTLSFFEFLRGNILSGFPWNLIAYSFLKNLNFLQINSLIGVYAFNMILITIFATPAILYLNRKKNELLGIGLIIVASLFIYIYGSLNIKSFNNKKIHELPVNLKIISTNIPIERYYSNFDDEKTLIELINLSNANFNEDTIFVWPEGVIPGLNLNSLKEEYNYLFEKSFSDNHFIILGINDDVITDNKFKYYNSLSVVNNRADVLYKYHKNKLVPFGEFLPLEKILSKLGLKSLANNYQSYSASLERKIFNFLKYDEIKILPLICYEIIYSGKLSLEHDYNIIINISEDGWFGNSIGPYQHFAHTVFRSIEYGKYTLRSANNGISAIIDPSGIVLEKININDEGVISIKQIKKAEKTLFSKFGNKMYFLVIFIYIFLILLFMKLKNE